MPGNAVRHLHKQWNKLSVYTTGGRLRIDNYLTENVIRPFDIGRQYRMFSFSIASANHYSLVETARADGFEPYAYLRMVLTELAAAKTLDTIELLLPFNQTDAQ